jgi:type VI secretion system secreted protein Hcp
MAPTDYFLKIDGIPGESPDSKHKQEIEVISFSWSVSRHEGKPRVTDFKIVKAVDKASPLLVQNAIECASLRAASFVARKGGSRPLEYLKLTMKEAYVTSVSPTSGPAGNELPLETVTLGFKTAELSVASQKADGSLDAFVTTVIDPSTGGCAKDDER